MLNTYFQGEATINQIRQLLLLSHRGCWNKSLWWVFSLADHTKASFFPAESEELLEKRKVNTKSTSRCFFFFFYIKTVFNIFRILFNLENTNLVPTPVCNLDFAFCGIISRFFLENIIVLLYGLNGILVELFLFSLTPEMSLDESRWMSLKNWNIFILLF